MIALSNLNKIVKNGLDLVKQESGLIEALVYASVNHRTVGRIVYTTHLPCNGLEEPKSEEDSGIAVEIWFKKGNKKLVGFGHEPNDISLSGVKRALAKAKRDAVEDPDFNGFLKLEKNVSKIRESFSTNKLMDVDFQKEAELLAKLSWEVIEGSIDGLEQYSKKRNLSPEELAFILNGDNLIIRERMALASTNGIEDCDESTVFLSFLTAMLEKENAKGSAWGSRIAVDDEFSAYEIGKKAALAAVNAVGGKRIEGKKYKVVFGPQAVTELFGNLLLPNLNLGMMDFGASIFTAKYGQNVASPLLTLYDDATLPGGAGSKRITCEGCLTGKTKLIEKGKLVGFLSDSRTTSKMLNKPKESAVKLGADPHEIRHAISPRNGFRFSEGGGRVAVAGIGIHATNLVIESHQPMTEGEILSKVGDGIYIGRLWYTYPVGGISSGIISGTAIADNYVIRNGKLAEPILPNTLRIEDNIGEMIKRIIGIGNNQIPTILWASDEITHAPWVAMDGVNFVEINKGK
jgi:predicted Zn-dependent protease